MLTGAGRNANATGDSHVVGAVCEFMEPDSDADGFQNWIIFPFPKMSSGRLGLNFHDDQIGSFYMELLRDKRTAKQRRVKYSLQSDSAELSSGKKVQITQR